MIIEITDIDDPRLAVYVGLTERQLRNNLDPSRGVFIAESPKVITTALDAGYRPLSILCEEKHITGDACHIVERVGEEMPIYTGSRELLAQLTGYTLTRGVLCAMRRCVMPSVESVLEGAHRICVMDGIVDTTNMGAIFRSAAALGIDAMLVTTTSCDPLSRRALRVSMGSVLLMPWTWIDGGVDVTALLHEHGFQTVAMALREESVDLDDASLKLQPRLALVMGNEGWGLSQHTIDNADHVVKIPMYHSVDSLNVAAASAIAFWELRWR